MKKKKKTASLSKLQEVNTEQAGPKTFIWQTPLLKEKIKKERKKKNSNISIKLDSQRSQWNSYPNF